MAIFENSSFSTRGASLHFFNEADDINIGPPAHRFSRGGIFNTLPLEFGYDSVVLINDLVVGSLFKTSGVADLVSFDYDGEEQWRTAVSPDLNTNHAIYLTRGLNGNIYGIERGGLADPLIFEFDPADGSLVSLVLLSTIVGGWNAITDPLHRANALGAFYGWTITVGADFVLKGSKSTGFSNDNFLYAETAAGDEIWKHPLFQNFVFPGLFDTAGDISGAQERDSVSHWGSYLNGRLAYTTFRRPVPISAQASQEFLKGVFLD